MKMEEVNGITFDSREVKPGYVFFAVKGLKVDGHNYIPEAVRNGASVIVGEKDITVPPNIKYIKVDDSRDELGKWASEFYSNPSNKLKIIGVTGTKGKTTTVHIAYHILSSLGKKVGHISSISAKIGNKESGIGFHVTNPDVIALNKFLSEMVNNGCEYAVVEVSSHGIDQKRIAGINFEVGVLTNLAPEHLDYHKTFEEYKRVKMSFIDLCKIKILPPYKTDINTLDGDFNNRNAEAAIRAVCALGVDRHEAIKTLDSFILPEGRLEEIKNDKGYKIIIDFAHTPDSFEAVLKHLRSVTQGRLITVFGSAGERDPYKRPKMGKVATKYSDMVILTAEDPRTEKVTDIIGQIKRGIPSGFKNVYEIPDRKKAIYKALGLAKKHDTVALLGKGHEKSMNLDGIHETPWSDREVIEKYLK